MDGVSVLVLLYGDHSDLAERCLGSVVRAAEWPLVADVRVGCNSVGPRTRKYLGTLPGLVRAPLHVYEPAGGANVGKYPLLRRMLRDGPPLAAPRVMWFDDDSYVTGGDGWWSRTCAAASACTLLGAAYRASLAGGVPAAVRDQPWYTGRPHRRHPGGGGPCVVFAQGGWWVADAAFLLRWNYPFPELRHNGGDTILGELVHQQRCTFRDYRDGVAINADRDGRESMARSRGVKGPRLWHEYDTSGPPDLSHHEFAVRITSYGA